MGEKKPIPMNDTNDESGLLTPSLEGGMRQIYSSSAMFGVAFFGGIFGVILFAALNSIKLKRLKTDLVWLLIAVVVAVVVYAGIFQYSTSEEIKSNFRVINRGGAFVLFGAFWLLYRKFYRALGTSGAKPLSPWGAAIGCVLAGIVITYVAVFIGFSLKGNL